MLKNVFKMGYKTARSICILVIFFLFCFFKGKVNEWTLLYEIFFLKLFMGEEKN